MNTVTISKREYKDLVDARLRYEYLRQIVEGDLFSPPPRSIKEILGAFRSTGRYNSKFLRSLERGLRRSSYFEA